MSALEREHTILIIDDQPLNLKVLADYLTVRGLQVLIAADGESGLERARYAHPDLIILDVLLPGMDGIETCRRLKADARTRAIPVLFMTVAISTEEKLRGFEAGGVDYLSKPIQEAELLARVAVHLRVQEQQHRLQQQAAELAQQHALLEERVAERTAALMQANQQLIAEIAERKQTEARREASEQNARRLAHQVRLVNQIGLEIAAGLEFEPLMQTLYEQCQQIGNTDTFYVALYDTATGILTLPVNYKDGERRAFAPRNLKDNAGLAGYIVEHPQTLHIADLSDIPPGVSPIRQSGTPTHSFIGVPLLLNEQVVGVLSMQSHKPNAYTPNQIATLEMLATQVAIAIQNSRLYAQVQNERDLANALVDNMPGVFCLVDRQGRLVRWNKLAERLMGYTPEEIRALESTRLVVAEEREQFDTMFTQVFADGQAAGEIHLATQSGDVIPVYLSGARIQIGDEPYMLGIGLDITERKQTEQALAQSREQLRNLAEYLQAACEQERTTIAREIHDEFGQALTALKIDLAWLARHLPAPSDLAGKVDIMLNLVDDAINTVRHIATELRPGLLDDLGLVAAIEWQTQDFARRTDLTYTLSLGDHDLDLEPDLATALFRILQESLTNVARHAEATHIEVALDDQPALLTLRVRDNGHGIASTQLDSNHSLGLMGMRERARVWGGDVVVEGRAGQGTTVTVHIPQPAVRAHALEEWL